MYYVLENDKPNFLENLFSLIKLKQNKIILPLNPDNVSTKKVKKLAQKTINVVLCSNSQKIVLSKELKKQETFVLELQNKPIHLVDGKWLFEMLVIDILDYLEEKRNFKKQEMRISILINEEKENRIQVIKELAQQYKSVNLITNHIEKFQKIEKQILEEQGIILTVTNNRKKSLMHSQLVINFDFPEELFMQYYLPEEAIILNLAERIEIKKKRFNGILIQDYEIFVKNSDDYDIELEEKFAKKEVYEAQFYQKQPYEMVKRQMKRDGVGILKLFSKNGEI